MLQDDIDDQLFRDAASIRRLILEGHFGPDEEISERKVITTLKDKLGEDLTRPSVVRGLAFLMCEGVIEQRKPGRRLYVREFRESKAKKLLDLRRELEKFVAGETAAKPVEETTPSLRRIMDEMTLAKENDEREKFLRIGEEFHAQISELGGFDPSIARMLWARTTAAYAASVRLGRKEQVFREKDMATVLKQHDDIFKAITDATKSPKERKAAARKAMDTHLDTQSERTEAPKLTKRIEL